MPTYKFTALAEQDLAAIVDYTLVTWGAAQAVSYIAGLEDLAATLVQAPDLGRYRSDLGHHLMVFPYEKHLLFYCKEGHGITVVRILHENMDTPQHFE